MRDLAGIMLCDPSRAYRKGRLNRRLRIYLAPWDLFIDGMRYLPLDDLGATIFFQLASALQARQHHTHVQQKLRRMRIDLRRRDHRNSLHRSAAASLHHNQRLRGELSLQGTTRGRPDFAARTITSRVRCRSGRQSRQKKCPMSFLRHGQIYRPMGSSFGLETKRTPATPRRP